MQSRKGQEVGKMFKKPKEKYGFRKFGLGPFRPQLGPVHFHLFTMWPLMGCAPTHENKWFFTFSARSLSQCFANLCGRDALKALFFPNGAASMV